jgi:hypothetical protein
MTNNTNKNITQYKLMLDIVVDSKNQEYQHSTVLTKVICLTCFVPHRNGSGKSRRSKLIHHVISVP